MTESEFASYREMAVRDYAQENIRAGNGNPADAPAMAEKAVSTLLPEGVRTKDQFLFTLLDESLPATVGMVWFKSLPNAAAHIYDIRIEESRRHRGYGLQTLQAVEAKARGMGLKKIGLAVFGHNQAARALYEKAGYAVIQMGLAKAL